MAMGITGLDERRSRINMTPLIDVLLVLLVIFIMVAPVMTKALQSELPRRADGTLPPEFAESQLVLRICADGRLLLNHEAAEPGELPARLHAAFGTRGGARVVFVDAEEMVPYGKVIEVMDMCRDAGAEMIGIVSDPPVAGAGI